jgi:hypothetical protein
MNPKMQHFLIISSIFIIVLWYQNKDDKKFNKKRHSAYEKYKFPILICSIVGLLLNIPNLICMSKCGNKTFNNNATKPFIHSWFSKEKQIPEQQIYTDLPDF